MIGLTAGVMVSTYTFYKDTLNRSELALALVILGSTGAISVSIPYISNKITKKLIN